MIVNEKVHQGDTRFLKEPITYIQRDGVDTCSYCGSLSPKEAIDRLLDPESNGSGADWKYGWPHKFYLSIGDRYGKFYSRHLYDADSSDLVGLSNLLASKLGIRFKITEKGLYYDAPYHGYQTWYGTGFDDAAPKVPEYI